MAFWAAKAMHAAAGKAAVGNSSASSTPSAATKPAAPEWATKGKEAAHKWCTAMSLGTGTMDWDQWEEGYADLFQPAEPEPTPTGETMTGVIQMYKPKRFGFVRCDEATEKYGDDIFCVGDQLEYWKKGDAVTVTIGLDSKKRPIALTVTDGKKTAYYRGGLMRVPDLGKLKAISRSMLWGGGLAGWKESDGSFLKGGKGALNPWDAMMAVKGSSKGSKATKGSKGAGKGHKSEASSVSSRPKRKAEPTGEVYVGTVKSLTDKYGFIECQEMTDAYCADCFCPGDQLAGFYKGAVVQFEVGINEEGKPQAVSVYWPDGTVEAQGALGSKKARTNAWGAW